jgi:hypothetical protein
LAPQAKYEVGEQTALTAITALIKIVGLVSGAGKGAETVGAADSRGVVETASSIMEMYQWFQASQGEVNALTELSSANPLPAVSQFLGVVKENEPDDRQRLRVS